MRVEVECIAGSDRELFYKSGDGTPPPGPPAHGPNKKTLIKKLRIDKQQATKTPFRKRIKTESIAQESPHQKCRLDAFIVRLCTCSSASEETKALHDF